MGLLGIILEQVYNKSFDDLVKEKICQPLNLIGTGISLNESQQQNFATAYNSMGKETPHWELKDIAAAGALRSTPKDMLTFLKENITEKDNAFKLSHTPTFTLGNTMGMAWHIMKTKQGNNLIWHNGATFGSTAFCGFIKEKNCAVVVLSNSGSAVDPIALGLLRYLQQ
jgi:CubicO group peptidase (beta-lactamase class C family)